MRKHIIFWVALGTIFLFSPDNSFAQAVIKFDAAGTASNVSKTITTAGKAAGDTIDTAIKAKEQLTILDKVKKWYEVQKSRLEAIKTTVEAGQEAYQSAVDVGETGIDLYEDKKSEIEAEMNAAMSGSVGNAAQIRRDIQELNKRMEERKNVLTEENTAKTKAAQENYETLQTLLNNASDDETRAQIEAQMSAAAQSITEYEEIKRQLEQGGDYLLNDGEYQSLAQQKASLEQQLENMAVGELESLASMLVEKLSQKTEAQIQQEYQEVINENFLGEKEPINTETTKRIMKHRREVLLKDIIHAFDVGTKKMISLPQKKETAEKLAGNILRVDLSTSAESLLIEMKIEELKNLFDYVEILLADMRLKTARNMLNQDFKLKDYTKNPAAINLDNYVFTEEDILSDQDQSSFLDNVQPK